MRVGVSLHANPNIMPDRRHPGFPVLTVHALRNVAGLMVDGGNNGARLPVKAHFGAVVADFLDGFADDLRQIGIALGADFTCDDGHAGRHEGFASHTGAGILFNQCIKDASEIWSATLSG